MTTDHWPSVLCSYTASHTRNPIRELVDTIEIKPSPDKQYISLALGDPTIFGNFKTHPNVTKAVESKLLSREADGYPPSAGLVLARQALAKYYSTQEFSLTENDVVLASGCSGALEMAINVLVSPGENILIPSPGFSIYEVISRSRGIVCQFYHCMHEKSWEIDLNHMESLINNKTKAILINNPSNPCGSVFSKEHLLDILSVAEKYKIPIIADEVYDGMVFQGKFYRMASLSIHVPILTCGGLTKRFMVPGWRLGWVIVHNAGNAFDQVTKGLHNLSTILLGPNSLIQAALPDILELTPTEYFVETNRKLQENAQIVVDVLSKVKGLRIVQPQGAFYLMFKIEVEAFRDIIDDCVFSQKLLSEESVFCLPAKIFKAPGFCRLVVTPPKEILKEACFRIKRFCEAHYL